MLPGGFDHFDWVIYDEVHSLDGPEGAALQRLIRSMTCKFLALSATVGNADELRGWMERVKGDQVRLCVVYVCCGCIVVVGVVVVVFSWWLISVLFIHNMLILLYVSTQIMGLEAITVNQSDIANAKPDLVVPSVTVSASSSTPPVQKVVTITKTLTLETSTLTVSSNTTVLELKQAVYKQWPSTDPLPQVRVVFCALFACVICLCVVGYHECLHYVILVLALDASVQCGKYSTDMC